MAATSTERPAGRAATLRSLRVREAVAGYLFVLPTLVGFLGFTVGPMLFSFGISLFEWEVLTPPRFVGLANYEFMLRNERFLNGFRNTLVFALLVVALNVAVAVLLAVAIQRRLPTLLRAYYRTAFFLPLVISTASVAIVLSFVFNREFGIANYYLRFLGIGPIPWLTSSSWALTTIVIATVWKSFGFDLIVFVAGLQSIPRHLYDAAAIDGANGWHQFWRITLPLLSPTIFFATVVGVIGNLQVFDQAYILTKGGPGDATRTVVMVIYDDAFGTLRMGYGSAIAVVLFALIMGLTLVQFGLGRRLVHYGMSRRFQVADGLAILLLTVVSVLVLMPFVFMLSTSLRLPRESFTLPPKWLPTDLRVQNYADVFALVPMGTYMLNSVKVTASIVVGQVATASLAAYAFARLRFPGKGLLFFLLMSAMMVPLLVTIIPIFVLVRTLGLVDSHASLILPALTTPFGVFLLRQFFLTIPRELEEAAVIDGAGPWQTFVSVVAPLGAPGIVVLTILAFNGYWNEFFRPLIFLNSDDRYTLPIGLVALRGYMGTNSVAVVMAGVTMAMLPVVLVFVVAQRRLIEGVALTGIKG